MASGPHTMMKSKTHKTNKSPKQQGRNREPFINPRLTIEKKNIFNVIEQEQNALNDIGHDVWRFNESGGSELQSCKKIVDFLKHKGFDVVEGLSRFETTFRAEFGEGELGGRSHPNVGFMCQYNAEPSKGHCYGHNLLTTNCLAAAIGLQRVIRFSKKRLGKVTVIGCTADAGKTVKKEMLDSGCFRGIDILLVAYPAHYTCLQPTFLASKTVNVTYRGRDLSDGVNPWETANPVNAVVMVQQNLASVRERFYSDWLINGVILNAGDETCTQPKRARCVYTIKSPTDLGITVLYEKLKQCLEGASLASGCTYDEVEVGLSQTTNVMHDIFTEMYRRNAKLNGFTFHNEYKDMVLEADDLSFVTHAIPTFQMFYYAGTSASRGTDEFNRFAGSPEAEFMSIVQGKTMAMMAVDMMIERDTLHDIFGWHSHSESTVRRSTDDHGMSNVEHMSM